MCRMGFVSSNQVMNHTNTIKNASKFYSDENPDGFGFAYVYQNKVIYYSKNGESAKDFWATNHVKIVTNRVIFHDRRASVGSISSSNSHPFVYNDIALAHNGTLHNFENLKSMLIQKGFNFVSQTDSEILLALWYFYGIKFTEILRQYNVYGNITILVLTPTAIYTYTNNNAMVVYKYKDQILGFSDTRILGTQNAFALKNNYIYKIVGNDINVVKA